MSPHRDPYRLEALNQEAGQRFEQQSEGLGLEGMPQPWKPVLGVLTDSPEYAQCSASSVYSGNDIGHSHGTGRLDSGQAWSAASNEVAQVRGRGRHRHRREGLRDAWA